MNHRVSAIAALVTAAALTGIFSTTPLASYASDGDNSETNTEQSVKQKNTGSGESTNFNCGDNLIDSAVSAICLAEPPPETATLSVCKETSIENTSPRSFTFTVTGNNPSPQEFVGDDSDGCVDVTIGPGEYAVSEAVDLLAPGVEITGNCEQDPLNPQRATGEIQAGETQECRFINSPGAS
jgi:hypothetical protein